MVDVNALLANAVIEGTTDKRREAFRNSISWEMLISMLEEIKEFRDSQDALLEIASTLTYSH